MIIYKTGNLLDTPDEVIVHGCNAQGVMGSGVAKAIREKYPKAYSDYIRTWNFTPKSDIVLRAMMGNVVVSPQPDGKTILNAITQENYGTDGKKYVSYDAIDKAMISIAHSSMFKDFFGGEKRTVPAKISMPRIGAGLGGGNWEVIEAIINHRLKDHQVTVWSLASNV